MILLAIALQVAAGTPQTRSILVPEPVEKCRTSADEKTDIVVCDGTAATQKLPLHEVDPYATPHGGNPNLTGAGALAAEGTPCGAVQRGCTVGFGPPIAPILNGAIGLVKSAFAKHPDKSNRIAIPLDEPAPAGHIVRAVSLAPTPTPSVIPAKAGAQLGDAPD